MSFAELRRECDRDGIGPLFWDLLVAVTRRLARKYPANTYNNGEEWSDEAFRDLAMEVTLERLLGENQLAYVLDLATDEDSLARLLAFQIRRGLARRRSITVVDRVLKRIKDLVERGDLEGVALRNGEYITATDAEGLPPTLDEAQVRSAVAVVAAVPRLPSNPTGKRESKVYNAEDLRTIVQLTVDRHNGISLSDVRRILEIVLTAWLPTILRQGEEEHLSRSSPEIELQRSHMATLIDSTIGQLEEIHRIVLLGKSQDVSDGELARTTGRSRPWIANRKSEVLAIVEHHLISQLPDELHGEATRTLLDELSSLGESEENPS